MRSRRPVVISKTSLSMPNDSSPHPPSMCAAGVLARPKTSPRTRQPGFARWPPSVYPGGERPRQGMRLRPARTRIGLDNLSRADGDQPPRDERGGDLPPPVGRRGSTVAAGRQRFSIISDGLPTQLPDIDPDETREWVDSFDSVVRTRGRA